MYFPLGVFGVSRTSATFSLHSVFFLGDINSLKGPVGSGNLLIGFKYFNSAFCWQSGKWLLTTGYSVTHYRYLYYATKREFGLYQEASHGVFLWGHFMTYFLRLNFLRLRLNRRISQKIAPRRKIQLYGSTCIDIIFFSCRWMFECFGLIFSVSDNYTSVFMCVI